jgi:hypothetical protein
MFAHSLYPGLSLATLWAGCCTLKDAMLCAAGAVRVACTVLEVGWPYSCLLHSSRVGYCAFSSLSAIKNSPSACTLCLLLSSGYMPSSLDLSETTTTTTSLYSSLACYMQP